MFSASQLQIQNDENTWKKKQKKKEKNKKTKSLFHFWPKKVDFCFIFVFVPSK
jgi:hypothetical protein